jgi:hypothetical protein
MKWIASCWFSIMFFVRPLKSISANDLDIPSPKTINIDINMLTISSSFHVQELFEHIQDNQSDMTIINAWFKIRKKHEICAGYRDNYRSEGKMLNLRVIALLNYLSKFDKLTVTILQTHFEHHRFVSLRNPGDWWDTVNLKMVNPPIKDVRMSMKRNADICIHKIIMRSSNECASIERYCLHWNLWTSSR